MPRAVRPAVPTEPSGGERRLRWWRAPFAVSLSTVSLQSDLLALRSIRRFATANGGMRLLSGHEGRAPFSVKCDSAQEM